MLARLTFVVFAMAVSVSARHAEAQETSITQEERERDAQALFALASRHYETGRLSEAIDEYSRAYALFPMPELQFNLYLAHRDAGNLQEASAALRLYLTSDAEIDVEERHSLQRRLDLMEANAAANATAGTRENVQTEAEAEAETHEVGLVAHEDEASSNGMSPAIGGVVLGVGGALLVGALIEGLVAAGKDGELDDICTFDMSADETLCPTEQQADIVSSFETHRNVAWGLFYSGVALAATGTILLLLSGGSDDDQPTANLECGPSGCIGSIRGAF